MTQYRKITEKIAGKLKLKEAYLFYCLALKSDFNTYQSHIKQESLAEFYGVKKTDNVREGLYKFQSCGLMQINKTDEKGQYGKFNRCHYLLNTEHYVLITDRLYSENISSELKGFLILLKCKCLNGTNTSKFSQNKLAKELNLSTGCISKYMKLAIDNGYINKDEKGIHLLREDIFLLTAETPNTFLHEHFPKTKPEMGMDEYYIILD